MNKHSTRITSYTDRNILKRPNTTRVCPKTDFDCNIRDDGINTRQFQPSGGPRFQGTWTRSVKEMSRPRSSTKARHQMQLATNGTTSNMHTHAHTQTQNTHYMIQRPLPDLSTPANANSHNFLMHKDECVSFVPVASLVCKHSSARCNETPNCHGHKSMHTEG